MIDENSIQNSLQSVERLNRELNSYDKSVQTSALLFIGQCMVVSAKILARPLADIAAAMYQSNRINQHRT